MGSCIASLLSDLLLAKMGNKRQEKLEGKRVFKVFRYVGDFLVLLNCNPSMFHSIAIQTINLFEDYLEPLMLTHKMPENDKLRFLDLRLFFSTQHICWCYAPRAQKPMLLFPSAHSKLVKRGIAWTCLENALNRPCFHNIFASFEAEVSRLMASGFPEAFIASVPETILQTNRAEERQGQDSSSTDIERGRIVFIP